VAHLALVLDPDPRRRERFAAGVRTLFADWPGCIVGEAHAGPVACLWVAGPRAPLDVHRHGDAFAVLAGYAIDDAGRWLDAAGLAAAWLADEGERHAQDGYHVGVAWDPRHGLAVGVDPLGFFPLYHAELPDGGAIVATTPLACRCHPAFVPEVDRVGLAGILFAHGLLDDRPFLAGVRRITAGCRLRVVPGGRLESRRVFSFAAAPPPAKASSDESLADAPARIGAEFMRALRRHRPAGDDTVLMLSGGLDSRLVAAGLVDAGIPTRAVSLGRLRDHELRAATAVAARLDLPLERIDTEDVPIETFVATACRAARFCQASSGPLGSDFDLGLALATPPATYVWSGISLDWVLEPVSVTSGFDAKAGTWSFDRMLTEFNAWGVPLERLPALLGRDGATLCGELMGRLESACTSGPLPPERQASLLRWDQRIRNHLAVAVHEMSFQSWPLMVPTDRRFFTACQGLPLAAYRDRWIERELLGRWRPDLATIPLDGNSFLFEPLSAGRPGRLKVWGAKLRRSLQRVWPVADPRRYERVFDVDQPRWRAFRRAAEASRPRLEAHLDAAVLAEVLPPPERRLRSRKPLKVGSPIRLLAGLGLALPGS
jgi:hypothetical protein